MFRAKHHLRFVLVLFVALAFSVSTATAQVSNPAPDIETQKLEARKRFNDALIKKRRAQEEFQRLRSAEESSDTFWASIFINLLVSGAVLAIADANDV